MIFRITTYKFLNFLRLLASAFHLRLCLHSALAEDVDNLIKCQPESVIIRAGTNNLTNGINMLNNAKKIVKELTTKLPKVKIALSD